MEALSPAHLPDLFAGAPVTVTGRYRGAAAGTVTVAGQRPDGWRVELATVAGADAGLAAGWARARIRDLEDRYAVTEVRHDQRDALAALEGEIVATSLRFGVLSRFTAFVAIDERVVNEGGTLRRVTQPVDLPRGWEPPESSGFAPQAAGGGGFAGIARAAFAAPAGPTRMPKLRRAQHRDLPGGPRLPRTPTPPVQPVRPAPELVAFAAEQLALLEAGAARTPAERAALLDALAVRLTALLDTVSGDELTLRPLRELAADLAGAGDLEQRWLHAVDVLEALAPRRPFWKR
jgi:Ca-activated chloride channel family protein